MTTLSLFQEEDLIRSEYGILLKMVLLSGKTTKYLHCLIRAYSQQRQRPIGRILNAIEDLETIGRDLCISIEEISSVRPLKIANSKTPIFLSSIKDNQIVVEYVDGACSKTSSSAFFTAKSARSFMYSIFGKSNINTIRDKERDILFLFEKLTYKMAEIRSLCNDI